MGSKLPRPQARTNQDALAEEPVPSLVDDLEQYELMTNAYGKLGHDFPTARSLTFTPLGSIEPR